MLDFIGGLEARNEGGFEFGVVFLGFVGEDDAAAGESVRLGVAGGDGFALGGAGAFGGGTFAAGTFGGAALALAAGLLSAVFLATGFDAAGVLLVPLPVFLIKGILLLTGGIRITRTR